MRIATWNLQSDRELTQEREARFRQAMDKVDADVWVLTETWERFSPGDGYRLAAESSIADDLMPIDRRWVAIWVKSIFVTEQQVVQCEPDRMVCVHIKNPGQRDVVVIGTVLPWHFDKRWLYSAGFCAALAFQVAEWKRLWGTFSDCICSVAGDFNQSLSCQQRRGYKQGEIALNDAIRTHDLLCVTEGIDSLTSESRIDHICVSRSGLQPSFIPHAHDWAIPCIGEKGITDHSGVFADLELT